VVGLEGVEAVVAGTLVVVVVAAVEGVDLLVAVVDLLQVHLAEEALGLLRYHLLLLAVAEVCQAAKAAQGQRCLQTSLV
jgi:hypothetical protein